MWEKEWNIYIDYVRFKLCHPYIPSNNLQRPVIEEPSLTPYGSQWLSPSPTPIPQHILRHVAVDSHPEIEKEKKDVHDRTWRGWNSQCFNPLSPPPPPSPQPESTEQIKQTTFHIGRIIGVDMCYVPSQNIEQQQGH